MIAASLLLAFAQPKLEHLKTPSAASPEGMSQIMAVRELADGRVLVVDMKEKIVQLLDRNLETGTKIGREGKGPGEYTMPMGLVPMAGDVTYLVDIMSQRFLPINADGSTAPPVAFSSLAPGLIIMAPPIADRQGRLFFQAFGGMSSLSADSVPVLRLDPTVGKVDTAGFFSPQKLDFGIDGNKVKLGGMAMFAPEDAWTATVDGRVVRAVPEPYHLVFYGGGKATRGPVQPYQPIKVTEAEKAEGKKAWEEGIAVGRSVAAQAAGRNAPKLSAGEPTFAPTKPPFPGRAALSSAPNGELWVERSRPFGDSTGGRYDRFNAKGELIGQVRTNRRSRVVGFGKGTVYVVRRDEDDLQYLERYPFPR